jgi:predicted RNA-binding protein YlqC (UPF0109 family)
LIVSNPSLIKVIEKRVNSHLVILNIYAHSNDIGLLIGKKSHMISSINTFISGISNAKHNFTYRTYVKDISSFDER